MIPAAVIAVLALIAVPAYLRYVERSRDSDTQALLQQLMLAEISLRTEANGVSFALVGGQAQADLDELKRLFDLGFRPDPRVGFAVLESVDADGQAQGIIAYAAHDTIGSRLFVYDNAAPPGARAVPAGAVFPPTYDHRLFMFKFDSAGNFTPTGELHLTDNLVSAVPPPP